MNRQGILEAALQAVTVDRAATHGDIEEAFGRLAALWGGVSGADETEARAVLRMILLKVGRAWGNPEHADNWIDIAGYAAIGGELALAGAAPGPGETPEIRAFVRQDAPAAPGDPWREKHMRAFGRPPEGGE